MRSRRWGWLVGAALALGACGGKVIVDGPGEQGTGGGSATGTASTSSAASTSSTGGSPCAGKACGDLCTLCNNVECIQNRCNSFGICAPDPISCP